MENNFFFQSGHTEGQFPTKIALLLIFLRLSLFWRFAYWTIMVHYLPYVLSFIFQARLHGAVELLVYLVYRVAMWNC